MVFVQSTTGTQVIGKFQHDRSLIILYFLSYRFHGPIFVLTNILISFLTVFRNVRKNAKTQILESFAFLCSCMMQATVLRT